MTSADSATHWLRTRGGVWLAVLLAVALVGAGGCVALDGDQSQSPAENESAASLDEAAVEQAILDEVNEERTARGLQPVTADPDLAAVADGHSEDMLDRDFYAHESPEGLGPGDRLDRAGVDCRVAGENIAQSYYDVEFQTENGTERHTTVEEVAAGLVEQWLQSPEHRENMLQPGWETSGVGVAVSTEGEVLATQLFCPT